MSFDFKKVQEILKTELQDEYLFRTAFTHRSYLNEHTEKAHKSNERLEFLGDAVLQLLSSEYLFEHYKNSPEGDMTNYRSAVVCTTSIGDEARRLGYGEMLLLSNGEESTGGREREYILANTFEAVLGALYLEKGLDFCKKFVERELLYKVEEVIKKEKYKDAKSMFQEKSQERFGVTPTYKIEDSWGPDHEKNFKVGVFLNDKIWGEGQGKSKQKAEQNAAERALEKLEKMDNWKCFCYNQSVMSLTIRLSRIGRKNQPAYKLVVANTRSKRNGQAVDIIGHYNPYEPTDKFSYDKEKFEKWVKQGAFVTTAVSKLIENKYEYVKYDPKKIKEEKEAAAKEKEAENNVENEKEVSEDVAEKNEHVEDTNSEVEETKEEKEEIVENKSEEEPVEKGQETESAEEVKEEKEEVTEEK